MLRRSTLAALALIASTSAGLAEACSSPGYAHAFALVTGYFQSHEVEILNAQLQFNAVAGREVLTADGVWGPATAGRVCGMLETYATINGIEPDGLIRTPGEAGEFVTWMAAMTRAQLNPGQFEAPD